MNCPFVDDGNDIKRCPRCGLTIRSPYPPEQCYAKCRRRGLGDYVESGLKAIGIHAKKKCGCGKRRDMLNRLGRWVGF